MIRPVECADCGDRYPNFRSWIAENIFSRHPSGKNARRCWGAPAVKLEVRM
jgi:hypothetical protein